ncbi:class I SAM-dependent methyltransferase [Breznakiella homolactica]|uniref:Class I SAM-dependent methyltransferase n=1 Tax=Breznakiella homolactica TaxID=2798577 RepID=A0A7T8B9I5_9SPIR|nr:class I SAM-dependent methyltransferase [Breznakiella homolactica]QQO08361.1 class I SAM-dependent methyltransferase [Breznakiella homolactica]
MDIASYNCDAWEEEVKKRNKWTVPADSETIAAARKGIFSLLLTPAIPVPGGWLGDIAGKDILCLASGGGQQGPVLAAAGATVTVFDNCGAQLNQDRLAAERESLKLNCVRGDMRDLSAFPDGSFDLIVHPVSNVFVAPIQPVWDECSRVLRPGGALLSGFCNPVIYIFDYTAWEKSKELRVRYGIPYSDLDDLPEAELKERIARKEPMEFGHSLDDQIGGQLRAGFSIAGFYEDTAGGGMLDPYIKTFIATRAVKQRL